MVGQTLIGGCAIVSLQDPIHARFQLSAANRQSRRTDLALIPPIPQL
jgi:hypothetical protein